MKKSTYKYLLTVYLILMIFISYINQGINNIGGLSYFVQFMPLGYLLPRVFSKLNSSKIFIISSFVIIIIFKLVKLLTLTGYFDITSIIIGFMGSYIIYRILK